MLTKVLGAPAVSFSISPRTERIMEEIEKPGANSLSRASISDVSPLVEVSLPRRPKEIPPAYSAAEIFHQERETPEMKRKKREYTVDDVMNDQIDRTILVSPHPSPLVFLYFGCYSPPLLPCGL